MAKRVRNQIHKNMTVSYKVNGNPTVGRIKKIFKSTNQVEVTSPTGIVKTNISNIKPINIKKTLQQIND